eukprot:2668970-Prymnesium_polylepis.1
MRSSVVSVVSTVQNGMSPTDLRRQSGKVSGGTPAASHASRTTARTTAATGGHTAVSTTVVAQRESAPAVSTFIARANSG